MKILKKKDMLEILPFGKTKLQELLISKTIPATKVGRDYIITEEQLYNWLKKNEGQTVDFWHCECYNYTQNKSTVVLMKGVYIG